MCFKEEICEMEIAKLYFIGNMLWRFLCGVVLLVTIWFASTVLYSSMQEGKLGWDILCSEEGRYYTCVVSYMFYMV